MTQKNITQSIVKTFKETKWAVKNLLEKYVLGSDGFINEFSIKLSKNW